MSNNQESIKKKKNILSLEIRKNLCLLPNIIKDKKLEKDDIYKEILKTKEKINIIKKDLDKITVNILNLENEFSLLMLKNEKIRMNQKLILNLIKNESIENNLLSVINKNKDIEQLISLFLNFGNQYKEEMDHLLSNNYVEITKLLIGAYSYLKALYKDIPIKYKKSKNNLLDKINKIKNTKEEKIFELIISYIKNIFLIFENKEKKNIYNKKHETLIKKKNEIFIKLKLLEEQKNEKEEKMNLFSNFIKDLIILIEKNKLLSDFPKFNKDIKENNKIIELNVNSLNISCPKNTINNELNKIVDKEERINIDLTNTSLLEKKYLNKTNGKIINCFESINSNEKMDINKYKNTYELEKDIYEQYIEIRNNPLFKIKKKIFTKKMNNNMNKENKIAKNKSKEKKKKEIINKNNTTINYSNNTSTIKYNINNLINQKEINQSYDSTLNKKEENGIKKEITNLNQNKKRIIQIKISSNSSYKKKKKAIKEETKNYNNEEENKEKANKSLNNNNINTKHSSIKYFGSKLLKKTSFNKNKANSNRRKLNIHIPNNSSIRKNSPENQYSSLFLNILTNKNIPDKTKDIFITQNDITKKNKSPNDKYSVNFNKNNKSKNNCHIIPFKKYKINYIRDRKILNKSSKPEINIYSTNSLSSKINTNFVTKNSINNTQIAKNPPNDEIKKNKKSSIKI